MALSYLLPFVAMCITACRPSTSHAGKLGETPSKLCGCSELWIAEVAQNHAANDVASVMSTTSRKIDLLVRVPQLQKLYLKLCSSVWADQHRPSLWSVPSQ
jgi:hypothetical protein